MKKLSIMTLLISGIASGSVLAANSLILNNISYQITEQQWVKSDQATAIIAISATVSDQNVASLRQSIMHNLQRIASGDWHITQFNRTKTSSGLQSVNARAQIFLPFSQLDQISARVKNVSKAGQTYSVAGLNFNPSPADVTKTQAALREKIYGDVQTEVKNLNKHFPDAGYFTHQIRFMSGAIPRTFALVKMPSPNNAVTPSVSQKVMLTANVVLSSKVNPSNGN